MKSFSVVVLLCLVAADCPGSAQQAAREKPHTAAKISVALVGDSTQTTNAGYGLGFCANLTGVICINDAKGGASTKTYYEEGYWEKALAGKPDYMLIQFGHNDEESSAHLPRETNLQTEYPANLERYVEQARAHGIVPVLVTPLSRRYYGSDGKIHSDLLAHAEAMKKVAAEDHVPLIDLQADSIAYLDTLTEAQGNALGITKKDAQGNTIPDKTHLNFKGSYVFGRMVAVDLGKAVPALARYVRPHAAPLPPGGVRSMAILHGAQVRIVLAGDSTVNNGGGWGPAFCALLMPNVKCINLARNGRSSKSYYDEGLWRSVLAQHADYILIQFGHNDMPDKGPARETDPDTTYTANMLRYIRQARVAGAHPVIVTSLSRRTFKDGKLVEDLAAYAEAARRVAEEQGVPVIDLNAESTRLLETMTQNQADQFDAPAHPDAKGKGPDRTHLNAAGAVVFGRMVAIDLAKDCPELGPDVAQNKLLYVSADGAGGYSTIQSAIDAAPPAGGALVLVAPGTYREVLTIDKPGIQLRGFGADASQTVVVFNRSAALDGGTSHTATVNVSGDDFLADDITFQNDFKPTGDPYPEGSQAVALRVTGDRALFHNVRMLGHQDTLYAASHSCTGTVPNRVCQLARQYFSDCYIEGNFDFIFGDAKIVIDRCEIHSAQLTEGFITAQSKVYPQQDSGYVIYQSKLTADPGATHVWLGRPWRPYSTVTYIDTEMDGQIEPAGWREWLPGKTNSIETATYSEFGSTGPGAHPGERDPHTHFLTPAQARQYAPQIYLRGSDHWDPARQKIPPLP